MNTLSYYFWVSIALPIAAVKGVWTGLASIPGYVRAEVRSTKNTFDKVHKTKETGKTSRDRRMDALRPGR